VLAVGRVDREHGTVAAVHDGQGELAGRGDERGAQLTRIGRDASSALTGQAGIDDDMHGVPAR
jgi:hypothetical protein